MMKRKIKIILIGLFSLLFMGLVYSLFSSKAEIISDESLRIEEPAMPELESYDERIANARTNSSILLDGDGAQTSDVSQSSDEPSVKNTKGEVTEDVVTSEADDTKVVPVEVVGPRSTPTPVIIERNVSNLSEENPVISEVQGQSNKPSSDEPTDVTIAESREIASDDDFLIFEKNQNPDNDKLPLNLESSQPNQGVQATLVPDDSGFLDLNLNEVPLSATKTHLDEEAGQQIFDYFNQRLSQFTTNEDVKELNPEVLARNQNEQSLSVKPSVFNMPAMDEPLMEGDSEISQQYRLTMSKLISINAKLRNADEENAELKTQFEIAVSQNRVLAQIIRDIDSQIKAFTVTN